MIERIFLISVFTILVSCNQGQNNNLPNAIEESKIDYSNLKIETPNVSEIDSSGILMMPLTIGATTDDSSFGGSFDSRKESFYWNIIFYNTKTSEKYLLSNNKILISNYTEDYYGSSSSKVYENTIDTRSSEKYLFFNIRNFDGNKNGKIDLGDPEYLFISDRTGKNLRQISPEKTHLVNWNYIAVSNKIILNVQNDENGDKIWNGKDNFLTYEYDLNAITPAKLIFDNNYKDSLKENFMKNWVN